MTISSLGTKVSLSGNGSNNTFAYNFFVVAESDLEVIIRSSNGTETVKSLTTHYTVSGLGSNSGGSITFTSGNTPTNTETVVIRRNTSKTQSTDYVANDPFPAESHEAALDKSMLINQELQEQVDRSIKISRTNSMTSTDFTVGATDRANKILAFDSSGEISVTQELGTFKGNWGASTAYNQRDIVKDTSTNNIFIVNTAHTSSGSQPLTTNANSAKYDLIVDAASATTSATNAASSATAAASSATTATTKATEAANSATAAATSETNAATSASTASTQASNAASSATSASSSASTTKASEASTSATNAASSATSASSSASTATTKASEASTSASNAASSASTASGHATTATTKASEAATSATNAATSATAADTAKTAAQAAQTAAEAAADNFDDTYLGAKSSDPTVDNDGDALTAGDLYFNTSSNELKVYNGSSWQVAASDVSTLATKGFATAMSIAL